MITYTDVTVRSEELEEYARKALRVNFLPTFYYAAEPVCRCYIQYKPLANDLPGVFCLSNDVEKYELNIDFYFIFDGDAVANWGEKDFVAFMVYSFLRVDMKFVGVSQKPIIKKAYHRIEFDEVLNKYFDNPLFFSYSQKLDLPRGECYDPENPGDKKSIMELMNDL